MKTSLVIPLKNESRTLKRLLSSISAQTRLPDEVVFVDAGSSDDTRAIVETFADNRFKTCLVKAGEVNPGTARNLGAEKAAHEILAFTDGGIELDKDWLMELSGTMERSPDTDVVYGHYTPRTDTLFRECLALAMMQPLVMVGGRRMRIRSIASSLMKRSVWRSAGGFPGWRAGEDRAFMEAVDRGNFKIDYNPAAVMVWDIPGDLHGMLKRFSSYSYHNAASGRTAGWHKPVLRMYIAALVLTMLGIFVSPAFFIALALFAALRTSKKVFAGRHETFFRSRRIPAYLVITGGLMLFIDMAMFVGWAGYMVRRQEVLRRKGPA
jgi:glycosyltransferase involved in cell wall biosynthesis